MSKKIEAIKQILANDEASTDAELVEHFMTEFQMSREEALAWVAKRNDYLSRAIV
jgi:hypothetical protein